MPFIKLNIFDKQFKFKCDKNDKIIDESPIVYFLDKNNSFYFGEESFDGGFDINEFYKKSRELIEMFPEQEDLINYEYIDYYLRHSLLYDKGKEFEIINNVVPVEISELSIPVPNIKEKTKIEQIIKIIKKCKVNNFNLENHLKNYYKYIKRHHGNLLNLIDNELNLLQKENNPSNKLINKIISFKSLDLNIKIMKLWNVNHELIFKKAVQYRDYATIVYLYHRQIKKVQVEYWEKIIRMIPQIIKKGCDTSFLDLVNSISPIEWKEYGPDTKKLMYFIKKFYIPSSLKHYFKDKI